jgi:hypothetical protein
VLAAAAVGLPILPRLGLSTSTVFVALVALTVVLVAANRYAIARLDDPGAIRLPGWRHGLAVALASLVGVTAILAVQEAELHAAVQRENDRTAERDLTLVAPYPPAALEQERRELTALLAQPAQEESRTVELRASLSAVNRQLVDLQDDLACEVDGTCGSLQVGAREIYEAKADIRDGLLRQQDDLRTRIDGRERVVARDRESAVRRLASIDGELVRLEDEHLVALEGIASRRADTGLGRRISTAWSSSPLGSGGSGMTVLAWAGSAVVLALLVDIGLLTVLLRRYRRPRTLRTTTNGR